jgi:hypothetical protein
VEVYVYALKLANISALTTLWVWMADENWLIVIDVNVGALSKLGYLRQ